MTSRLYGFVPMTIGTRPSNWEAKFIPLFTSSIKVATVYILYSPGSDRYYIGSCSILTVRLEQHKDKLFKGSFTSLYDDWRLFLSIDGLEMRQARSVEKHIKKMKSKTYLKNLLIYPDIIKRLIEKYRVD